jgi:hypothetical protein
MQWPTFGRNFRPKVWDVSPVIYVLKQAKKIENFVILSHTSAERGQRCRRCNWSRTQAHLGTIFVRWRAPFSFAGGQNGARFELAERETIFYPSVETPTFGIESTYWQNDPALFFSRYRFRQPDLLQVLLSMGLHGKQIMVGKKGHYVYYPADFGLMVVLRRLSYPCRFFYLVQEFGIPSYGDQRIVTGFSRVSNVFPTFLVCYVTIF